MRAKFIPVPTSAKTFWSRITVTRLTTCFFALALLHCIVQVVFQVMAFKTNEYAGAFLDEIIGKAGITGNWAVLVHNGELRLCGAEDTTNNIMDCPVVWTGQLAEQLNNGTATSTSSPISEATQTPQPVLGGNNNIIDDDDDNDSIASDDDDNDRDNDFDDLLGANQDAVTPVTTTVFEFASPTPNVGRFALGAAASSKRVKRTSSVTAIETPNGNVTGISLASIEDPSGAQSATIDLKCVEMLVWPNQMIRNTKRQDVTFIAFQVWVFAMSLAAVLNESIPHIIAALMTHVLASVWSGYQIWNTSQFRSEFVRTTIDSEVCRGINLLPEYWARRNAAEIGVLVINVVSLFAYIFFTWKLVKSFGWQTFKRIGASLEINRIYKLVLIFSIGLQLALFFIVASMGLWLDFLLNMVLGQRAWNGTMYKIIAIVVIGLMVPWLLLGWYAVRRENRLLMSAFLGFCLVLLAGWGGMFASNTFRWTFKDWSFFAAMSAASSALILLTTILGLVCFMNFNKGLKRFLQAQEPLPGDDFAKVSPDAEKAGIRVDFPSAPIPTYESAFGSKERLVSPIRSPFADVPEYTQSTVSTVAGVRPPPPAAFNLDRAPSNASSRSNGSSGSPRDPFALDYQKSLRRLSGGSEQSGSVSSQVPRTYVSAGSHHVPTNTTKHVRDVSDVGATVKRGWVIE